MKKFETVSLEEQRAIEVGSFTSFLKNADALLNIVSSGVALVTSYFGFSNTVSAHTGEIKTKTATYKWQNENNQLQQPIYFTY